MQGQQMQAQLTLWKGSQAALSKHLPRAVMALTNSSLFAAPSEEATAMSTLLVYFLCSLPSLPGRPI